MDDYGRDALAEISSRGRARIASALGVLAESFDLDHEGPAARFLASVAATIRKAERDDFLRLDALEDAINEPRGEIVPDGVVTWRN
jgi:hypothetical protein